MIGCSACLIWYSIPNVNRFLHFLFPLPTCINALSFKRLQGMNNKAMSGASLTSIRAAIIQAPKLFHKIKSLNHFLRSCYISELLEFGKQWFTSMVHLFLRFDTEFFVPDDVATSSEVSFFLLLCPLELLVSCDVSRISSANNLYLGQKLRMQ